MDRINAGATPPPAPKSSGESRAGNAAGAAPETPAKPSRPGRKAARLVRVKVIYREWLRTGSGTKLLSERTAHELRLVDAQGRRVNRYAEEA